MKEARRIPIYILEGMILVFLSMSFSNLSFGEFLSPVPMEEKTTKTKLSPNENKKEAVSFRSKATGFRSEESEAEQTSNRLLPLQRGLSTKDPELSETTDASGGTMIHLKGKFQCGLKVPHKAMDNPIEESLSPAIP